MADENTNPPAPGSAPADADKDKGQADGLWLKDLPEDVTYEARGDKGQFEKKPLREHPEFAKFKSPADLARAYAGQLSVIGRKAIGLLPPGEDATDEERAAFDKELRKAMKVPETVDGYEIKLSGQAVPKDGLVGEFLKGAHEAGLTPGQAQKVAEAVDRFAAQALKEQDDADKASQAAAAQAVTDLWKDAAPANTDLAKRGFEAAAAKSGVPAEEAKAFAETYGDNLTFLRVFHLLGKQMAEDGLIDGAAPAQDDNDAGDGRTDFSKAFGG